MKGEPTYRRASGALEAFALFALWLVCAHAPASVAVLLEEPYGGMGRMNPTGHTALYFDHICAESPTMLRACREGELGVVISRYDGIGTYDWIAMPLVPYLYAVDSAADVPLTVDKPEVARLREAYRRTHLESVAPDLPDGSAPAGNWYELAGSAYDRTIYGFQVKTTAEQDAALIATLNDRKNVERYNGAFRNCADFARVTINRFYPHAIRRNFVADFGLTTPKSVARALAHYGGKHPEAELTVFKVPQVRGTIPRSHHTQGVAESLLTDYGVPLVLISPVTATVVLAAYIQHGRFSVPKDAPTLEILRPEPMLALASDVQGVEDAPIIQVLNVDGIIAGAQEPSIPVQSTLSVEGSEAMSAEKKVSPGPQSHEESQPAVMNVSPLLAPIGIVSMPNRLLQ